MLTDRNTNRPGYKNTKVGWIPEEWEAARVDSLGRIVTGSTPKTSHPEYYGGARLFVTPADLGEDRVVRQTLTTLTESGIGRCRAIPSGSVLFVCIGSTIGKVGIAGKDLATNQQINAIIPSKENDGRYICDVLFSRRNRIALLAGCQAVPIINKSDFSALRIPIPPLPEQKKIAEILSTWDEGIEQTRQLITAAKRRKKALMQKLLTGKRRLKGFTKRAASASKLAPLIHESRNRNTNSRCDRVLSVTNNRGFIPQHQQFSKKVASEDVAVYKLVHRGQFAYNPSRINVGSIDRLDGFETGILSPMYVVFDVDETKLASDYLRQFIRTHHFSEQVRHMTEGTVRDSLGFDALSAIRCFLPEIEEQRAIAAVLQIADEEIAGLESKLAVLEKQKRGLMQKLLSGEVRVNATGGIS